MDVRAVFEERVNDPGQSLPGGIMEGRPARASLAATAAPWLIRLRVMLTSSCRLEPRCNGVMPRVVTVGDLQDYPGDLRALVGSFGPKLKQFSFGEDDRPLEIGDEIKSR